MYAGQPQAAPVAGQMTQQQAPMRQPIHDFLDMLSDIGNGAAVTTAPQDLAQNRAKRGDENLITMVRHINYNVSAAQLGADPSLAVKTYKSGYVIKEGEKLIPLESHVTMIQNNSILPLCLEIEGIPKTAECVTADGSQKADIVLFPYTATQPILLPLYTSNPNVKINIDAFKGWARVDPPMLLKSVMQSFPASPKCETPTSLVNKHSPLYDLMHGSLERLGVQMGVNAYEIPMGNTMAVAMPTTSVNQAIAWGNDIIASMPFVKPNDMVVTLKRLDGKPFTEVSDYVGTDAGSAHDEDRGLNGVFSVGVTITELYKLYKT